MPHTLAHGLQQQAHRLARNGNIAFHAQDFLIPCKGLHPGHQIGNIGHFRQIDHDGFEIIMLVIIMAIVVAGPGGQIIFGSGIQPKDHSRINHTVGHRQNGQAAGRLGLDHGAGRGKASLTRQIGL